MRITAIEKQDRRPRVNIYVDGEYAFSLSLLTLAESGLQVDSEITPARAAQLQESDARYVAYQKALHLLAYRPRSERELRRRLKRKEIPEKLIDETTAKLKAQGYLDDAAFARSWVESRSQSSPRGKRLLRWELRAKGVDSDLAAEVAEELSDDDAAYRAAQKRQRSLQGLDLPEFRRRLGDFLARRGFSWDTVRRTTDRLWEEIHGEAPDDEMFH
jgi:regulatory protein